MAAGLPKPLGHPLPKAPKCLQCCKVVLSWAAPLKGKWPVFEQRCNTGYVVITCKASTMECHHIQSFFAHEGNAAYDTTFMLSFLKQTSVGRCMGRETRAAAGKSHISYNMQ